MRFLFLLFLTCVAAQVQAASTWLCNAADEPLYISVRHYAPSLFVQNARTEGWKKLPVRGITRSCGIYNRHLRDHVVVVGVLRGGEVVPVVMTPRRRDRRGSASVCVPTTPGRFEYRSGNKSDRGCRAGYVLAKASFIVEGGKNDVDMDLSGPIDVALSQRQKKRQTQIDRAAREKRRRAAEERQRAKAERAAERAEYERKARLADSDYLREVEVHLKETLGFADGFEDAELKSTVEGWMRYLDGKVLRLPVRSTYIEKDEVIVMRSEPGCETFCFPIIVVAKVDRGKPIPPWLRAFATAPDAKAGLDALAFDTRLEKQVGDSIRPKIRYGLLSFLTGADRYQRPLRHRTQDAITTLGGVMLLPHLKADGTFSKRLRPALCLESGSAKPAGRYTETDYLCGVLSVAETANGPRVDMTRMRSPRAVFGFNTTIESVVEMP